MTTYDPTEEEQEPRHHDPVNADDMPVDNRNNQEVYRD